VKDGARERRTLIKDSSRQENEDMSLNTSLKAHNEYNQLSVSSPDF